MECDSMNDHGMRCPVLFVRDVEKWKSPIFYLWFIDLLASSYICNLETSGEMCQ